MIRYGPGAIAIALVALLLSAGCNRTPPLPKTYPASGIVVYKGGTPMKGGNIQFNSASDPLLRIVGDIDNDGKFTLRTVKDSQNAAGAPEGEFQVIVQPPAVVDKRGGIQDAHKGVAPITLEKKYKVTAGDNNLKIELPGSPP